MPSLRAPPERRIDGHHRPGSEPRQPSGVRTAAARPGVCPCCGAAAQPLGGPLVVVGHGVVERQVRGPRVPHESPVQVLVQLRRYRCRACRAVLMVGPRGLLRGRWYGAGAIGQALALYARGTTSALVRARTSPSRVVGGSARERWVTLTRWVEAARRGELLGVRVRPVGLERRGVAEQVMLVLAARAGHALGADLSESAFAGALIAA
jgi:zinc-finger of transposase IS204/IS1001/IS1096/IS1165